MAGPAAALAKITASAVGVASMAVAVEMAVAAAVTVAEGTQNVGRSLAEMVSRPIPGVWVCRPEMESRHGAGGNIGQGSAEPEEVKATSAVWPDRASDGILL